MASADELRAFFKKNHYCVPRYIERVLERKDGRLVIKLPEMFYTSLLFLLCSIAPGLGVAMIIIEKEARRILRLFARFLTNG